MLLILAFALGAVIGWRRATRRGGDRFDKLQYGAVHGIAFTLAALILLVAAGRMGLV
jgi:hypothetical protein